VVVGGLFLADTLGFLNLSWRDFWPLVLIGAGPLEVGESTIFTSPTAIRIAGQ
jgi:hypothetical protein